MNTRLAELKAKMEERRLSKAKKDMKETGTSIVAIVKDYLIASKASKEAKKIMENLKPSIKEYLKVERKDDNCELTTSWGMVKLETQPRPKVSSKYMTYDPSEIQHLIPAEYQDIVFERVVNGELLEELVKSGLITSKVLDYKFLEDVDYLKAFPTDNSDEVRVVYAKEDTQTTLH